MSLTDRFEAWLGRILFEAVDIAAEMDSDEALEPADLGVVTHTCICGSNEWKVVVSFDDFEVATISTEMYCRWCGAKAVTPTPLDRPDPDRQD